MSAKAVVGRALRETGAALKQASGMEVSTILVLIIIVVESQTVCQMNAYMSFVQQQQKEQDCEKRLRAL